MSTITFAGYGVWNSTIDVTTPIQQLYSNGTRKFFANNNFGDPSVDNRKYLYIVWTHNGQIFYDVIGENDTTAIILP